jgi:TonB family protein
VRILIVPAVSALALVAMSAIAQDAPLPRATPIGNPGAWIPPNAYPPAAKASAEEGRVAFTLMIDESGSVSDCKVTTTSESPLLDETTCNYMTANGRFTPPRDKKNKPVASQWSSSVRWKLEAPPPPVAPATGSPPRPGAPIWYATDYVREAANGSWFRQTDYPKTAKRAGSTGKVVVQVTISGTGLPTSCWAIESSGIPDLDATTCIAVLKRGKFVPAKDSRGNAIESSVVLPAVRWELKN